MFFEGGYFLRVKGVAALFFGHIQASALGYIVEMILYDGKEKKY
jgi:hypothetical protein